VGRGLQVSPSLDTFHFSVTDRWADGFTRDVYLINGQQPGPLIEIDEGDDLEVFVKNELSVESTIHWHG
jgi:FtsP/CotA-like multicopper oxidase with cupredoxin domain